LVGESFASCSEHRQNRVRHRWVEKGKERERGEKEGERKNRERERERKRQRQRERRRALMLYLDARLLPGGDGLLESKHPSCG
jgi:hypothetical protein